MSKRTFQTVKNAWFRELNLCLSIYGIKSYVIIDTLVADNCCFRRRRVTIQVGYAWHARVTSPN